MGENTEVKKSGFVYNLMNPATPDRFDQQHQHQEQETHPKDDPTTPPHGRHLSQGSFQSPDAYTHKSTTGLPPTTPRSHHRSDSGVRLGNVPMTPMQKLLSADVADTPLKSPSQLAEDGENPPIRQITTKLRTRLNFAMLKYSHGWANQSLDELERSVAAEDMTMDDAATLEKSPFTRTNALSPSKVTKPHLAMLSPRKSTNREHRRSMEPLDAGGSANAAFLHAISKSRSPRRRPQINTQSLRLEPKEEQLHGRPEAEAIETLMSLSSPRSVRRLELSRTLPRARLSFGDEDAVETESENEKDKEKEKDETDVEPESP